jgi:hypothetical protein
MLIVLGAAAVLSVLFAPLVVRLVAPGFRITLVMAGALLALRRELEPWFMAGAPGILRLAALAILEVAGLLVYAVLLQLLRVARIGDLIAAVRGRV